MRTRLKQQIRSRIFLLHMLKIFLIIGAISITFITVPRNRENINKPPELKTDSSTKTEKEVTLKHDMWSDKVKIKDNRFCRSTSSDDCASVTFQGSNLIVKWNRWPEETFVQTNQNTYTYTAKPLPENTAKSLQKSIEQQYSLFDYSFKNPFIVVNPYKTAPLTALIKFATDQKARITLTIHGKDGSPDITHTFPAFETEHSLPVLGLYANYKNRVTITAAFEDHSTQKNTVSIQTKGASSTAQWFVLQKSDQKFYYYATYTFDVFDEKGNLRYFLNLSGWRHSYFFKDKIFVEDSKGIYRYDMLGFPEKHYTYPNNFYTYIHGMGHKPNGNLLVFGSFNNVTALIDGKNLPTHRDFVLELDYETGKEVARYDLAEMLNPDRSLIVKSTQYDYNKIDWAHTNGISYDDENKAVIVSGRHFGIAKIDEKTKKLIWWFTPHQQVDKSGRNGQNGSLKDKVLTVVDRKGRPYAQAVQEGIKNVADFKWPLKTHSVLYAGNGIYSIFDNSGELFDKKLKTTKNSYAAVYKIDDKKRTVRQIFKKDLNVHTDTGSIVYVHPKTQEIWTEIDNIPSEHNYVVRNSFFIRFDKNGKKLYEAVLPNRHVYAIIPFKFYENNFLFPVR